MIDFYYWPTPNGWKVAIMLEECGLEYRVVPVDIGKGEQFRPEFLEISPNHRMPAIVDHDAAAKDQALSALPSTSELYHVLGRNFSEMGPDFVHLDEFSDAGVGIFKEWNDKTRQ